MRLGQGVARHHQAGVLASGMKAGLFSSDNAVPSLSVQS